MKGLFLPEITTEDFRDGCLESIEALIGEGEIYDIDYSEPCEDAISRQAVLDATVKRSSIWNKITNSKGENLEEIISQLPPVTLKGVTVTDFADRCRECGKMRKGHWIYDKTIENWRCSKCNETPKTMGYVGTADFMAEHFKFCNHCGAKMEGENKE